MPIKKCPCYAELLVGTVREFGGKKYKAVKICGNPYYTWVKTKEPITKYDLPSDKNIYTVEMRNKY